MKYRKGYKYQLAEAARFQTAIRPPANIITEFIHLLTDGQMILRQGYAWDGPSGPTIDTRNSMQGALKHDALYQLLRGGHLHPDYRVEADIDLYHTLVADGMFLWRARLWYDMVRKLAGPSADPANEKKTYEAP